MPGGDTWVGTTGGATGLFSDFLQEYNNSKDKEMITVV